MGDGVAKRTGARRDSAVVERVRDGMRNGARQGCGLTNGGGWHGIYKYLLPRAGVVGLSAVSADDRRGARRTRRGERDRESMYEWEAMARTVVRREMPWLAV